MDDLFDGLGAFFDSEMIREGAVASLGGIGAGLAFAAISDMLRVEVKDSEVPTAADALNTEGKRRTRPYFNTPIMRLLLAGGVGVGGGFAAWRFSPTAATGLVGAMMGQAGQEVYNLLMKRRSVSVPTETEAQAKSATAMQLSGTSFAGLASGLANYRMLADASVYSEDRGGAFNDISVEMDDSFDVPTDVMSAVVSY